GPALEPLEAMWCFASPLVGRGSVELLLELLRTRARAQPIVYLAGLPPRATRTEALLRALGRTHQLAHASTTVRRVARVDSLDGFLSRRSAKLRASLRRAQRAARDAGIAFESLTPGSAAAAERAYARVLAIEARSWKSATDNGVDRGPMRD